MKKKQISLKQLQRAIAKERVRLNSLSKRENLEKELKQLRRSGRTDFAGRIGRGFVILSKKAGGIAMKQARLIRNRQIEESKMINKKRKG